MTGSAWPGLTAQDVLRKHIEEVIVQLRQLMNLENCLLFPPALALETELQHAAASGR